MSLHGPELAGFKPLMIGLSIVSVLLSIYRGAKSLAGIRDVQAVGSAVTRKQWNGLLLQVVLGLAWFALGSFYLRTLVMHHGR